MWLGVRGLAFSRGVPGLPVEVVKMLSLNDIEAVIGEDLEEFGEIFLLGAP